MKKTDAQALIMWHFSIQQPGVNWRVRLISTPDGPRVWAVVESDEVYPEDFHVFYNPGLKTLDLARSEGDPGTFRAKAVYDEFDFDPLTGSYRLEELKAMPPGSATDSQGELVSCDWLKGIERE